MFPGSRPRLQAKRLPCLKAFCGQTAQPERRADETGDAQQRPSTGLLPGDVVRVQHHPPLPPLTAPRRELRDRRRELQDEKHA